MEHMFAQTYVRRAGKFPPGESSFFRPGEEVVRDKVDPKVYSSLCDRGLITSRERRVETSKPARQTPETDLTMDLRPDGTTARKKRV